MNIAQIENNISNLCKNISADTFIYDLLLAYGLPKASITRLQKGNLNLSKRPGEISWKRKVLFRGELKKDLHLSITQMAGEAKHDQRFIITTDYKTILAVDTKTNDKLDILISELHKQFDFFLPWAGMEKSQHQDENPADIKAAEKMAMLFDEIKRDNPGDSPEFIHDLNVFLSRLLFCYFAEDTNIFEKGQFTNAISSHTQADGSDLGAYLDKLFVVLNTQEKERKNLPVFLAAFPYVNGGLFKLNLKAPTFTRRSRQAVIDCGDMDWSAINPDIFGSMMQAVVTPENRGGLGMHYTSVPNIMKVIKPLFLDELYEEFEKAKGNQKKLNELLARIYKIKIFDPACGSGNFLIIAYKELRKLEVAIFKAGNTMPMSRVSLAQFYGIEIDDFAHEIAKLSLWLAEHQMNVEFYKEFGKTNPTLPLKESGHIVQGNACRIDWECVCPKHTDDTTIYVIGNPPYQGFKFQNDQQKEDMDILFANNSNYKFLDYISCWFIKAAIYSDNKTYIAFVSTNSICQGIQVEMLWPIIFTYDIEVAFAYQSFKWRNSAKENAGVTCVIIGLRKKSSKPKYIINKNLSILANNINPYLIDGPNIIVTKRREPLSNLPKITDGSGALDGGNLIISAGEFADIQNRVPNLKHLIRRYMGSDEFINGVERYCIWIDDKDLHDAKRIEFINNRIKKVYEFRKDAGTRAQTALHRPHKFAWINIPKEKQIIIPTVSSERRRYIPIGFLDAEVIVSNAANIVHDPAPYVFSILSSRMHMVWVKTIAGKLEERIRYTSAVCYNTFPVPNLSANSIEELTKAAFSIIAARERTPEKILAELYDPEKMPMELETAHKNNDDMVDKCYRSRPFESDEERLEHLFNLYEQMIAAEQNRGTLFETEPKHKRGKK
jgi:hypothetical protein